MVDPAQVLSCKYLINVVDTMLQLRVPLPLAGILCGRVWDGDEFPSEFSNWISLSSDSRKMELVNLINSICDLRLLTHWHDHDMSPFVALQLRAFWKT